MAARVCGDKAEEEDGRFAKEKRAWSANMQKTEQGGKDTHLNGGNLVNVGFDGSGELDHELSTLASVAVQTPNGVVCLLGSVDGAVDIFGRSLRDLTDLLACGRVDDLQDSHNALEVTGSASFSGTGGSSCRNLTSMVLPPSPATNSLLMKRPGIKKVSNQMLLNARQASCNSPPEKDDDLTAASGPKLRLSVGADMVECV